jgi:hypothetical protein
MTTKRRGSVAILNVHQSKSSDHDRLGFHPDCPACRHDRLFGVLSPEPIWSRRLRVLLAASVLAVSAGATTTSVASEPDDQQEGVVVPAPGARPVGDGPGQGSGGETALPFEVDPVLTVPETDPTTGQPEDAAPIEAAPVDDPDGGLTSSDPSAPAEDDAPAADLVPPAEPTPPGTSAPPAPTSGGTDDQPGPADQAPAAEPEQRSRPRPDHRQRRDARKDAREQSRGEQSQGELSQDGLPAADSPPAYTPATDAAVAPAPQRIRGGFHVALPGESLWSIASAILDTDASPAAVALEVRRLWRLNEERIGTGDPNLLPVGVRLRLR